MPLSRPLQTLCASVALLSLCAGCSSTSTCSRDPDEQTRSWKDGVFVGNTYKSGDYGGPYIYFPPARTLTFDLCEGRKDGSNDCLPNGKDFEPLPPQIWLAFSPNGTLAPSAGNESLLEVLETNKIAIKNDTCAEFWVWLVAEKAVLADPAATVSEAGASGSSLSDSGASDAGGSDGGVSGAGP